MFRCEIPLARLGKTTRPSPHHLTSRPLRHQTIQRLIMRPSKCPQCHHFFKVMTDPLTALRMLAEAGKHSSHPVHVHPVRLYSERGQTEASMASSTKLTVDDEQAPAVYRYTAKALGASMWFFVSELINQSRRKNFNQEYRLCTALSKTVLYFWDGSILGIIKFM